jgi:[ribosomal protein S18]-alanine N-acetyltransferase
MSYVLRGALLDDLPEIIRQEQELFGTDAWAPELVVAELSHPANHYLVAEYENHDAPDANRELVGYAGLRANTRGGDGDIQTIAVVAHHRGKGVGRMLLHALLAEAARRELAWVFLEVRADNDQARSLYRSSGFVDIDRRVGYYQPDGVDAVVMRLELTPRPSGLAVGRE